MYNFFYGEPPLWWPKPNLPKREYKREREIAHKTSVRDARQMRKATDEYALRVLERLQTATAEHFGYQV